jgi:hypothetical protein
MYQNFCDVLSTVNSLHVESGRVGTRIKRDHIVIEKSIPPEDGGYRQTLRKASYYLNDVRANAQLYSVIIDLAGHASHYPSEWPFFPRFQLHANSTTDVRVE